MMKVVCLAATGLDELGRHLARVPGVAFEVVRTPGELRTAVVDAEAVVMMNAAYDADLAEVLRTRATSLRLIQLLTAGFERLQRFGIPAGVQVATAGDSRSPAVAEHAIGLMLAMVKRMPEAAALQRGRRWDESLRARVSTLAGRRLLVVGFGSIGREVARLARAFGMEVVGVTRTGRSPAQGGVDVVPVSTLARVLPGADVVLVAVPSTAASRRMIGTREIGLMKRDAILVNVARGDVVDAAALARALAEGRIAGAALDVVEGEPLEEGSPLWTTPNLLLTPHVGGSAGAVGHERLACLVADNMGRLSRGESLRWLAPVRADGDGESN